MKLRAIALSTALLAIAAGENSAYAAQNVKVGALRCDIAAGLGLIIASRKEIQCNFVSTQGRAEKYYGVIEKLGIDIGATNGGVLAWNVFAPIAGMKRHALAGKYAGADASASLGVGLGANILLGGSKRSFALQPISLELQSGVALAAGVTSLTLRSDK